VAASEARFVQVAHALVASDPPVGRLLAIQERAAFVEIDDGSVALVIWPSLRGDALRRAIGEVLDRDRVTHLKILIVGCGQEMRELLGRIKKPALSRRNIQTFHLSDDGEVWAARPAWLESPFGRVLARVAACEVDDAGPTRSDLQALQPPPPTQEERERTLEHLEFIDRFQATKPRATYALLAWLAAVFGLEHLWGGTELVPTLVRMGANTESSLSTEPWRLLASASLHAGPLHFGINAIVLFALGRFFEKVLGWERLVVLYVAAALGGALASALAFSWSGAALSVGASGAIWGFLGAAFALSWRPGNVVPRNLVGPMRRTAGINLLINLGVSFLPQVDLWAHLGGGLAGAALVLLGPFTRGIDRAEPRRVTRWRFVASTALLLLVASSVVAVLRGMPWRLVESPVYQTHVLDEHGVAVDVPVLAGDPTRYEAEGQVDFVFGSALQDPVAVAISVLPHRGSIDPEQTPADARLAEAFFAAGAEDPPGVTRVGQRQVIEDAPFPSFEDRFVAPNGLQLRLRYALLPHCRVVVEVADWGRPAHHAGVAVRIVESLALRGRETTESVPLR
jgi:rhomboid protease GluP